MIKTAKIKFKKITKNDLKLLRDWRNSEKIFRFNSQYTLLNIVNQTNWFKRIKSKKSDRIMFLITADEKPIGVCGLIHIDLKNRNADVAIIIGNEKFQGKGFGTISLKKLIDYGFKKLRLNRIGADIFEFNLFSINLFQKLNFKHELTLRNSLWRRGRLWNVLVFSLLRNEYLQN